MKQKQKAVKWKESKLKIYSFSDKNGFWKILGFFSLPPHFSFVRQSCFLIVQTISLHILMFYLDVRLSGVQRTNEKKNEHRQLHSDISLVFYSKNERRIKMLAKISSCKKKKKKKNKKRKELPIIMSCNCMAKHLKVESTARNCASRLWPNQYDVRKSSARVQNLIID